MARSNRNSRRRSSAPGWVWMLFGLSLGLIVAVGVYLRLPSMPAGSDTTVAPQAARAAPTPPAQRSPRAAAAAPAAPAEDKRFEFYEILPQSEVVLPDDGPRAATGRPRAAATPGSFLLQTGSFGTAADADRHQASLALLGFESHVQRVTIDDAVFHRVRIGPIVDGDAAKRTQRRLREAGIDSLLMQVPK